MSNIQIGFCTVISNKNFSVFQRIHCPWVNIQISIEFLHKDLVTGGFKDSSDACSCNSFTDTGKHTSGDTDEFHVLIFQVGKTVSIRFVAIFKRYFLGS